MPSPQPLHLCVEADLDPLLPGRLLGRLTVAGRMPEAFSFAVDATEMLRIEVMLPQGPLAAARRLAIQIGAVATVRRVVLRSGERVVSLEPAAEAEGGE
jgi:hypothetical protein